MSIRIMTAVWDADMPAAEKLVLLALADCANDQGGCWPSIRTLTAKTSLSERKVQMVIKWLKDNGHLERDEKPGKGVFYTVHPRTRCTPAQNAPPQDLRPTPAPRAPKPSITVKKDKAHGTIAKPDDVTDQVWEDFIALRKAKRAPLTQMVMRGLRAQAELAGWSMDAALTECVMRGWQAFKADWVKAQQPKQAGGYSSADSERLRAKYGAKVFTE